MKEKLQYIINDLTDCFDGKPWYGESVLKKLKSISWSVVNDKKYGDKTIAVLVQHIINWRIFVLKKLQGDENYNIIIDELNDWTILTVTNEEDWKQLIAELEKTQQQLLSQLAGVNDELLEEKVPGKEYKFGPILRSLSQHDVYHLGQISMLNAMAKTD